MSSQDNPKLSTKLSSQRRSSDGPRELAQEIRVDRDEWRRRQNLLEKKREQNRLEREKRKDERVKMICESFSHQETMDATSHLTPAERRILEVDSLIRSLPVKLTELTATIRTAK